MKKSPGTSTGIGNGRRVDGNALSVKSESTTACDAKYDDSYAICNIPVDCTVYTVQADDFWFMFKVSLFISLDWTNPL